MVTPSSISKDKKVTGTFRWGAWLTQESAEKNDLPLIVEFGISALSVGRGVSSGPAVPFCDLWHHEPLGATEILLLPHEPSVKWGGSHHTKVASRFPFLHSHWDAQWQPSFFPALGPSQEHLCMQRDCVYSTGWPEYPKMPFELPNSA